MGGHKVFDEARIPYYEGDPILPSQFVNERDLRPEEMLCAAVLEKAISDLECSDHRTRIFRDALRWFERDIDPHWNFTTIAQNLRLNPEAVRVKISEKYGTSANYAGMPEVGGLSDIRNMADRLRFSSMGIAPTKTKRGISIHSHNAKKGGRRAAVG